MPDEFEVLMGVVGMLIGCGIANSGELGTEASERILWLSNSASDIELPLPFFLRENALLNELLSWESKIVMIK